MTREEAHGILSNGLANAPSEHEWCMAYEMAIKALEQEHCEDTISHEEVCNIVDDIRDCKGGTPDMMREEFEAITGAKVGYYFYAMVIEPLYNATPECFNKFDYCTLFTKMSIAKTQKLFYEKHPEMKEEEKLK